MNHDGQIDYTRYSRAELSDALKHIDAARFPKNYHNLLQALAAHPERKSKTNGSNDTLRKRIIPVGKYGLIEIALPKRTVPYFRVAMLILTVYFGLSIYEVISQDGVTRNGEFVARGESWGYYTRLFRDCAFALFFLWMATLGVRAKSTEGVNDSA